MWHCQDFHCLDRISGFQCTTHLELQKSTMYWQPQRPPFIQNRVLPYSTPQRTACVQTELHCPIRNLSAYHSTSLALPSVTDKSRSEQPSRSDHKCMRISKPATSAVWGAFACATAMVDGVGGGGATGRVLLPRERIPDGCRRMRFSTQRRTR